MMCPTPSFDPGARMHMPPPGKAQQYRVPSFRGVFAPSPSASAALEAAAAPSSGVRRLAVGRCRPTAAQHLDACMRRALSAASSPTLIRAPAPPPADRPRLLESTLQVRILRASSLRNTDTGLLGDVSDPYVILRIGGDCIGRTPTISNNLNPEWQTGNEFTVQPTDGDYELQLEVMNSNFGRDDTLGAAGLIFWELPLGAWRHCRLPLGGQGEIEVEVRLDRSSAGFVFEEGHSPSAASSAPGGAARSETGGPGASEPGASPVRARRRRESIPLCLPTDWDALLETEGVSPAVSAYRRARSRSRSQSSAGSRGRGATFALPEDALDVEQLDFGDVFAGPASTWPSSYTGSVAPPSVPRVGEVEGLAFLDESLRRYLAGVRPAKGQPRRASAEAKASASPLLGFMGMGGAAEALKPSAVDLQESAEERAISKAKEREAAIRRSADEQLAQALKALRLLDAEAARPPDDAAAAASSAPAVAKADTSAPSGAPPASMPAQPGGPCSTGGLAPPAAAQMPGALPKAPAGGAAAAVAQRGAAAKAAAGAPPSGAVSKAAAMSRAGAPPAPAAAESKAADGPTLLRHLQSVEPEVQRFKQDAGQKAFRSETKKVLNLRFGQVSATQRSMRDCLQALTDLLDRQLAGSDASRRRFVEFAFAERIADEAEVGIMSQPRSAWSKARVAARIFAKSPEIWTLFQGFVFRACPFSMPDFSGAQVGRQGPLPGQRAAESFTQVSDRMVAYHRLWLTVLVIQGNLGVIWRWLAKTLNEREASSISAPLLVATLEAAGADAQARYGRQFAKLVDAMGQHYLPQLQELLSRIKGEESDQVMASESRLRRWIESFRRSGRAPVSIGREVEVDEEQPIR